MDDGIVYKLFIGNIPYEWCPRDVDLFFREKIGVDPTGNTLINKDHNNRSKGNGYIFCSPLEKDDYLSLDSTIVDGRKIKIREWRENVK